MSDVILNTKFDNFSSADIDTAMIVARGKIALEVSGDIDSKSSFHRKILIDVLLLLTLLVLLCKLKKILSGLHLSLLKIMLWIMLSMSKLDFVHIFIVTKNYYTIIR